MERSTWPEIGEVIATRELTIHRHADGAERAFTVEIGKPFQREPQGDFCCPFRIVGLGSGQVTPIFGVDSLQALQSALVLVRVKLESLARHHQGSIRWLGEEGSWGLPASVNDAVGREN